MRWNLDDLPLFNAVVEHGGITAAADALGRPKSTVSTALARLEQGLGVKLMERNTRSVRLTPEGESFHAQCQLILDQAAEADALMTGLTATPTGRLTVALPGAFCQEVLAPHLPVFQRRYPGIALDLRVSSRAIDPVAEQVDMAIVVGAQADSTLTRRVLLGGRLIWVAAPAYAAAQAIGPGVDALAAHIQLCETRYALRRVPVCVDGVHRVLTIPANATRVNDPLTVRRAVIEGGGVSFLPERYCARAIAEGELVEVCPHIALDMEAAQLSAVFPSRRLMSARVRVFLDYLVEICAQPRTTSA